MRAADITKGEIVIEVGPGEGVLTESLLNAGAHVIAIEKDDRLIEMLKKKFAGKDIEIIHADIADYNLDIKSYKVIANIPYYITGEILRKFLSDPYQPIRMVLMIQKEVAERIIDSKESILSISVKAYGTPSLVRIVTRENFKPAPNVDSAVLLIENISREFFANVDEQKFFDLVRKGFAHKRKKLGSNLGLELGNKRAEELTVGDWKNLYTDLSTTYPS